MKLIDYKLKTTTLFITLLCILLSCSRTKNNNSNLPKDLSKNNLESTNTIKKDSNSTVETNQISLKNSNQFISKSKQFIVELIIKITSLGDEKQQFTPINSLDELVKRHENKIKKLFTQLDLDNIKLKKVKDKYNGGNGNLVEACKELLKYYKNKIVLKNGNKHYLNTKNPSPINTYDKSEKIIQDRFTFLNETNTIPTKPNGHRDWYFNGKNSDPEWAWLSNRHDQVGKILFRDYLRAQRLGDTNRSKKYINYIDVFLQDFITDNLEIKTFFLHPVWRGLEVGTRAINWSRMFYRMIDNNDLSEPTKILMLASLYDHAYYLNHHHKSKDNWVVTEMLGLAHVGLLFPEFKKSNINMVPNENGVDEAWKKYAFNILSDASHNQVYPDGVQQELSFSYHRNTTETIVNFKKLYERNLTDREKKTSPFNDIKRGLNSLDSLVKKMNNYIALTMRPNGTSLLNGDSNKEYTRNIIIKASSIYDENIWRDIAHNKSSTALPSVLFPWAGHFISRCGFEKNAHWSFFDIGPLGTAHQHNDKLHVSISAFGKDFLVDSGRFAYSGEVGNQFRKYAESTLAHNCVLIDSKGQSDYRTSFKDPIPNSKYLINDDVDFISGETEGFIELNNQINHRRSFTYLRNKFWLIVDKVTLDEERNISYLWHWHPQCSIVTNSDSKEVTATWKETDGAKQLTDTNYKILLKPISNNTNNLMLNNIKGHGNPPSFYSEKYNNPKENTTSIYSENQDGSNPMVWLIYPFKGVSPPIISAQIAQVFNDKINIKIKINDVEESYTLPYNDKELLVLPCETD